MGKLVVGVILGAALIAGAALYYLQVYGFYDDVPDTGGGIVLTPRGAETPEVISYTDFRAIDANSSPIRFRACFRTPETPAALSPRFETIPGKDPRNAPFWFDCFDAEAIAAELEAGSATTFLGQKNIAYGVDRIVAITADGRGYVWHDLNDCGEKAYDGTVVGEECPPLPARVDP